MQYLLKLCFFISITSFSFGQRVIDTLHTEQGTILIFANRTWEYLEDRDFDGILNPFIHSYFENDSLLNYTWPWEHDLCYASNKTNDLTTLKDTIWVCLVDSNFAEFSLPHEGRVTSRYGWRKGRYHNGIDISLTTGDTVVSAFSGKVRYARYNEGGFGNLVVIRHFNGLETFYAHLSKHLVVPNQLVEAGEPIGLGGNTGRSKGAHLHFETRFYDAPMDPEEIIDFKNKTLKDENLLIYSDLFRPGASASNRNHVVYDGQAASHVIRKGDTLGHIARKHGTSVSRLCQLNGIKPTTTLNIGRSLRVR